MRRNNIFWGGVLILLGVLFLLQTQNIIPSIFPYLWPLGFDPCRRLDGTQCILATRIIRRNIFHSDWRSKKYQV